MKDYYAILRIHQSASPDEVKEAYRRMAHKHHPDKGGSGTAFKDVHEAYEILLDQEKRRAYDASLIYPIPHTTVSTPPSEDKRSFTRSVLIPVVIGIVFFILGDGQAEYNGYLVFIGWLFIAYGGYKYLSL